MPIVLEKPGGISVHYTQIPGLRDGRMTLLLKTRVPYYAAAPRRGAVGETLFVQETWREHGCSKGPKILYRADGFQCPICALKVHKWRCSNSMPEEISRFRIKILEVAATTLHSVTIERMIAEGFYINEAGCWTLGAKRYDVEIGSEDPATAYALNWDFRWPTGPFWNDTDTALWALRFEISPVIYRGKTPTLESL